MKKQEKRAARLRNGILYSATGLFALIAARIIVMIDPHFQRWPPVIGWAVSFGVVVLIVGVEVVRGKMKDKRTG
jgi:hypothetical protein